MKRRGGVDQGWKPRRRGEIFCSPLCGGLCTWRAYQCAVRAATTLAKRLGKGWTAQVSENLGWHYAVQDASTCLNVYPNIMRDKIYGYSAYLNEAGQGPGGRWVGSGKTPEAAIADAIRQAKRELAGIKRLVKLVESA